MSTGACRPTERTPQPSAPQLVNVSLRSPSERGRAMEFLVPRLPSRKKKTAFGFPFSEAQLPHNAEHNQRLVKRWGYWHKCISLGHQLKMIHSPSCTRWNLICVNHKPRAVGPSVMSPFKHNSQETSLEAASTIILCDQLLWDLRVPSLLKRCSCGCD